jgi:hypothetical protein
LHRLPVNPIRQARKRIAYGGDYARRRREVLEREQVCWRCLQPGTEDDPLEADHVVPVAIGGGDGPLGAPVDDSARRSRDAPEMAGMVECSGCGKSVPIVLRAIPATRNLRTDDFRYSDWVDAERARGAATPPPRLRADERVQWVSD